VVYAHRNTGSTTLFQIVFATTAKDSCQASRALMIPILPVV